MSLYADGTFTDDAKTILADLGVTFTDSAGNTFLAMVTDPSVTQALQAGGFLEQTSFTAKVAATTSAWTASDNRVGGSVASLTGGVAISTLATGKTASVANLGVRIVATSHKPGSAWVILQLTTDTQ
jgi:hypothetical protein|tara:strand:- start:1553 stop:1933 length:381 start_codon:yes stop_codon:yes gene_type:complete